MRRASSGLLPVEHGLPLDANVKIFSQLTPDGSIWPFCWS